MAEENEHKIIVEDVSDEQIKLSVNKENVLADEQKIVAVRNIQGYLENIKDWSDEQCIVFYNKLLTNDHLLIAPTFYLKSKISIDEEVTVVMNKSQYELSKRARSTWTDGVNLTIYNLTWISSAVDNNGYRNIGIQVVVYWNKYFATWGRDDYLIIAWSGNQMLEDYSTYGETVTEGTHLSSTVSEPQDVLIRNECDVKENFNYVSYKGKMQKMQGAWDYTSFAAELTLKTQTYFNYKSYYYHDQGLFPYSAFLNSITVSAGFVSLSASSIFVRVKEYTSNIMDVVEF